MRQLAEQNRQLMERLAAHVGISEQELGKRLVEHNEQVEAAELIDDDYEDPEPDPDPDPPAAPETNEAILALVKQNQEMLATIADLSQQNQKLQAGRKFDGSVSGGFIYPDGQIHFNKPKLSGDQKWEKMEEEGGLLG